MSSLIIPGNLITTVDIELLHNHYNYLRTISGTSTGILVAIMISLLEIVVKERCNILMSLSSSLSSSSSLSTFSNHSKKGRAALRIFYLVGMSTYFLLALAPQAFTVSSDARSFW